MSCDTKEVKSWIVTLLLCALILVVGSLLPLQWNDGTVKTFGETTILTLQRAFSPFGGMP
jgi:hypothetical protein